MWLVVGLVSILQILDTFTQTHTQTEYTHTDTIAMALYDMFSFPPFVAVTFSDQGSLNLC